MTARTNPYGELIDRILHREEKLSVSSFKEFAKSPRHFMAYKLREKKETPAMLKGTVMHCLILEGEEDFKEKFIVADKPYLRLKGNKEIWAAVLNEAEATGKKVIEQSMYDKAAKVRDYAYSNESIRWVMDSLTTTEKKIKWELGGYKWHGFADGIGESIFTDLKGMADASPKKAKWTIRDMRYLWQGYLYSQAPECKGKDFYIVCLEDMPNGCVIEIENKALQAQAEEIEHYLWQFKKCVFEGAWNRGYDYFTKSGIYNYSYL